MMVVEDILLCTIKVFNKQTALQSKKGNSERPCPPVVYYYYYYYSHIFPGFRAQHCNYATLLAGRCCGLREISN